MDVGVYYNNMGSYSYKWSNKIAPNVRERDDHICQNCGKTDEEHCLENGVSLHVHHIVRKSYFESVAESTNVNGQHMMEVANKPANLVTLCASCHKGKIEREGEGCLSVEEQCELLGLEHPLDEIEMSEEIERRLRNKLRYDG